MFAYPGSGYISTLITPLVNAAKQKDTFEQFSGGTVSSQNVNIHMHKHGHIVFKKQEYQPLHHPYIMKQYAALGVGRDFHDFP